MHRIQNNIISKGLWGDNKIPHYWAFILSFLKRTVTLPLIMSQLSDFMLRVCPEWSHCNCEQSDQSQFTDKDIERQIGVPILYISNGEMRDEPKKVWY